MHDKFLMFSLVVLAMVNFGPLVEQAGQDPDKSRKLYDEIDTKIFNFMSTYFDIPRNQTQHICVSKKMDGGFDLMVPGLYWPIMQD